MGFDSAESAEYDRYVRTEWALFAADSARRLAVRDVLPGLHPARVLDIGCGAGQEMRPFLEDPRAFGVGIDLAPDVGRAGRVLFARDQPESRVAFVRAAAERLPFPSSTFDVVVCRLALPYMDNAAALAGMARVLKPAGVLLLKIHHARFYIEELRRACLTGRFRAAVHACRVIVAGAIYHATGRQPRNRITGSETFQTLWLLRRELRRCGLEMRELLPDSVAAAPSMLVTHRSTR